MKLDVSVTTLPERVRGLCVMVTNLESVRRGEGMKGKKELW